MLDIHDTLDIHNNMVSLMESCKGKLDISVLILTHNLEGTVCLYYSFNMCLMGRAIQCSGLPEIYFEFVKV